MSEATWDSDNTFQWRQFLTTTETGQRLLPRLVDGMPVLLDGADVNKTLVRNGEVRGWSDVVRELNLMAFPPPEPPTAPPDPYPDLDDPEKWDDSNNPKL